MDRREWAGRQVMSAAVAWALSLLTHYLAVGLWYHQWLPADAIGGVGVLTAILLVVWTPILYVPCFRWATRAGRPLEPSRLVLRLIVGMLAMALIPSLTLVALFSASRTDFLRGLRTTVPIFYGTFFASFGLYFTLGLLWLFPMDRPPPE
jgi:hypothetical protein